MECADIMRSGTMKSASFRAIEFDKDDIASDPVNFIVAASNIRSSVFGIPPIDRLSVRKIAGNILPAIITTTSAAAGLACIELIKIAAEKCRDLPTEDKSFGFFRSTWKAVKTFFAGDSAFINSKGTRFAMTPQRIKLGGSNMKKFRNSFFDLSSFSNAYSQPALATIKSIAGRNGEADIRYSDWDFVEVSVNLMLWHKETIAYLCPQRLLWQVTGSTKDLSCIDIQDAVYALFGVQMISISLDNQLLFADYLPNASTLLHSPIYNLLPNPEEFLDQGCKSDLNIFAIDSNQEVIQLPPFRVPRNIVDE